ncbi:MAG: trehalose-phosphatase [Nitrospiraceae bacterium]|nr:trehalose-phosphatase [Nitrospiraceae bacterium]
MRGEKANGGGPAYFFGGDASQVLALSGRKSKIALFLDFDGTLVPIQKDPALCALSAEAKRLLQLLAGSGSHFVAVLSGRELSDIKSRVGLRNICYGGNHGLSISGKGMRFVHPDAAKALPIVDKAARRLNKETSCFNGVWIERKKYSVSLHYRLAEKVCIPQIKKIFYRVAEEFSSDGLLRVMKGKKVLELMPDISWDKGRAALWILNKLQGEYLPVFVGDDATDETAFEALENKGITVRVGRSGKTFAHFYLKHCGETLRLLQISGGFAEGQSSLDSVKRIASRDRLT